MCLIRIPIRRNKSIIIIRVRGTYPTLSFRHRNWKCGIVTVNPISGNSYGGDNSNHVCIFLTISLLSVEIFTRCIFFHYYFGLNFERFFSGSLSLWEFRNIASSARSKRSVWRMLTVLIKPLKQNDIPLFSLNKKVTLSYPDWYMEMAFDYNLCIFYDFYSVFNKKKSWMLIVKK